LRDASIAKLQRIILIDPDATRLGELLVLAGNRRLEDREIRRSLGQFLSKKSSCRDFVQASLCFGHECEMVLPTQPQGLSSRLKEFDVYSYLGHLESDKVDLQKVLSPRVRGFAH
jgi:hypothetical protein